MWLGQEHVVIVLHAWRLPHGCTWLGLRVQLLLVLGPCWQASRGDGLLLCVSMLLLLLEVIIHIMWRVAA